MPQINLKYRQKAAYFSMHGNPCPCCSAADSNINSRHNNFTFSHVFAFQSIRRFVAICKRKQICFCKMVTFFSNSVKRKRMEWLLYSYRKSSIKPPRGGGLIFFKYFWGGWGGLKEKWGAYLRSKVSRGRTCGSRAVYCFANDKKMVTILHGELERKIEKVKHMELEVMRPKTKNNMNLQPE